MNPEILIQILLKFKGIHMFGSSFNTSLILSTVYEDQISEIPAVLNISEYKKNPSPASCRDACFVHACDIKLCEK